MIFSSILAYNELILDFLDCAQFKILFGCDFPKKKDKYRRKAKVVTAEVLVATYLNAAQAI